MLRTPKSYSLYPYLGPMIPLGPLPAVGRLWPSNHDEDGGVDEDDGDDDDQL